MLVVQRISHDCAIGEAMWEQVNRPRRVHEQGTLALRFADRRVQAVLNMLVLFRLLPHGFSTHEVRPLLAVLLGQDPTTLTLGG